MFYLQMVERKFGIWIRNQVTKNHDLRGRVEVPLEVKLTFPGVKCCVEFKHHFSV